MTAASETRTIHFISLGCPKNRVDTEVMLGVSDQQAYRLVDAPEDAEVIVVNTCGFIQAAKDESIETIVRMGELKQQGRLQRLVVAGCLSQRYPDELSEALPEVDHFLGSSDMLKLGEVLATGTKAERMLVGHPAEYLFSAEDPRRLSLARHSAYVKIAEGCSRKCSFCSIPSFRGTQRSRGVRDIVREVEQLVAQGTVEINLISQDTISYGRDLTPRHSLAELVKAIGEVDGLRWLRLFYLYPERLDDALVELLASHPKVVPYIDMPLQHASDDMLVRMRRGHGGDRLKRVVEGLRQRIPHATLRTAFIVGHPGETDADFDALCEFVGWAEFDHVGVFRYSLEESTHSHGLDGRVSGRVAENRRRKLMALQRKISRTRMRRFVGQEIEVLVEGVSGESEFLLEGRHAGQAPDIDGHVILANGTALPGEIRRAKVTHAADYDLVADLLDSDTDGDDSAANLAVNKKSGRRLRIVS